MRVLLGVVVLTAVACGGSEPAADGPSSTVSTDSVLPSVEQVAVPRCDVVEPFQTNVELASSSEASRDEGVLLLLSTWGERHPDRFGGLWIDPISRTFVIAVVGDVASAEAELAALDLRDLELDRIPPTELDGPLGPSGVRYGVVEVSTTEAELIADIQPSLDAARGLGLDVIGGGLDGRTRRVSVEVNEISDDQLIELAALIDPTRTCVTALGGRVVPDDALMTGGDLVRYQCGSVIPPVELDALTSPRAVDDDITPGLPAALERIADQFGGTPAWPSDGPWFVLSRTTDEALLIAETSDGFGLLGVERIADDWAWANSSGTDGDCELRLAPPEGTELASFDVVDSNPTSSAVRLRVHDGAGCDLKVDIPDELLDPVVAESDGEIRIQLAYRSPVGPIDAECSDSDDEIDIELEAALGGRTIIDGSAAGLTLDGVWARDTSN